MYPGWIYQFPGQYQRIIFSKFMHNYILIADGGDTTVCSYPSDIHSLVCQRLGKSSGRHISVWFYDVFIDQDDVLSEALMIVTDLYKILSQNNRYL